MLFTVTRQCAINQVDETVQAIVKANLRDKVEAGNNGQVVLKNVSITALPSGCHRAASWCAAC